MDGGEGNVIIVIGSPADREWAERIERALDRYDLRHETHVASAHKTPAYLLDLVRRWESSAGPRVYITVAGRSNALSGFLDAQVSAPVIACPPPSESYGGMDILSSLRMPRGVAPMVVLEPENAALAAAKMLGLASAGVRAAVDRAQEEERQRVIGAAVPAGGGR
jgi:phosphoribosylaminoimidazole carboxylase PurE protein